MDMKNSVQAELSTILISAMALSTSLAINEAIKYTISLIPTSAHQLLSKWSYVMILVSILIMILMIRYYARRRFASIKNI